MPVPTRSGERREGKGRREGEEEEGEGKGGGERENLAQIQAVYCHG